MRTADATGVTGIILIGDCTDPFSVESVRASMGAVSNVDLINCSEMMFLNFVKKSQYNLIGTSVSANLTHKKNIPGL